MSLLDFSSLKPKLEDELNIDVDLVDYDTVKPLIKEKVLKQEKKIV